MRRGMTSPCSSAAALSLRAGTAGTSSAVGHGDEAPALGAPREGQRQRDDHRVLGADAVGVQLDLAPQRDGAADELGRAGEAVRGVGAYQA